MIEIVITIIHLALSSCVNAVGSHKSVECFFFLTSEMPSGLSIAIPHDLGHRTFPTLMFAVSKCLLTDSVHDHDGPPLGEFKGHPTTSDHSHKLLVVVYRAIW